MASNRSAGGSVFSRVPRFVANIQSFFLASYGWEDLVNSLGILQARLGLGSQKWKISIKLCTIR